MNARLARLAIVLAVSSMAACSGSTGATGSATSVPAPAVAAAPRPFEYAAGTSQYRYFVEGKASQGAMGNTRDFTSTVTRVMTVALARSGPDTITMNISIDSLTVVSTMPSLGTEKAIGAKFTAKIGPNGSFYSVTGPSEADNPAAAAMADEVGRAMPRLKAILSNGVVWTDTIKDNVKQAGLDVSRFVVTKFTVMGDSMVSGEASWKIQREATVTATGTGNVQGQGAALEMTGSAKGILLMSKKGVLMGGRGDESTSGTVTLSPVGVQITLTNSQTTQFSKVK